MSVPIGKFLPYLFFSENCFSCPYLFIVPPVVGDVTPRPRRALGPEWRSAPGPGRVRPGPDSARTGGPGCETRERLPAARRRVPNETVEALGQPRGSPQPPLLQRRLPKRPRASKGDCRSVETIDQRDASRRIAKQREATRSIAKQREARECTGDQRDASPRFGAAPGQSPGPLAPATLSLLFSLFRRLEGRLRFGRRRI